MHRLHLCVTKQTSNKCAPIMSLSWALTIQIVQLSTNDVTSHIGCCENYIWEQSIMDAAAHQRWPNCESNQVNLFESSRLCVSAPSPIFRTTNPSRIILSDLQIRLSVFKHSADNIGKSASEIQRVKRQEHVAPEREKKKCIKKNCSSADFQMISLHPLFY